MFITGKEDHMEDKFARVVVDLANPGIGNKFFHYRIPGQQLDLIQEGARVLVPFGGRKLSGFVTGFDSSPEIEEEKIRDIINVIDPFPLLTKELIELAGWISQLYLCPLSEVLKTIVPGFYAKVKAKEITLVRIKQFGEKTLTYIQEYEKRAPKQAQVLNLIMSQGEMPLKDLLEAAETSHQTVNALEKKGLVEFYKKRIIRDPFQKKLFGLSAKLKLNIQQSQALETIKSHLYKKESDTILLHGVTGSGKTEVYLQAIEEVIKEGREALVLVPEISLTPQMVSWFRARFGSLVTVLHSKLSAGERYDQWCRILEGEIKIAVGPRSAIFAPFTNLGIIIIDEEHESTYKQEESPRYDARKVAERRSWINKCPLILGSATPSVDSYYQAASGFNVLVKIDSRVEERPLPPVNVVDLKKEIKKGNKNFLSSELYREIESSLEKKQQVILFINRRGFASFVVCKECGFVQRCPNCSITLTYHSSGDQLKCHYCHYERKVPKLCPDCQGYYIRFLGLGTQRVEREVKEKFPFARILRMDRDSTSRRHSHQEIFKSFKQGKADILIGTQMVAKGLDFPRVTLVGVIAADTALNLPDFRAGERTFQLLTQVAGRTGRSSLGGKVLIQTYCPDHYSILTAMNHDYQEFYEKEINLRKEFGYPPYSCMLRVVFSGSDEKDLSNIAGLFKETLDSLLESEKGEILGPGPCPLSKIKGRYRWHLVLKSSDLEIISQVGQKAFEDIYSTAKGKNIRIALDVNPLNML